MLDALADNFNQAYARQYDYTVPDEVIEVVTFRLEALGLVEKPQFEAHKHVDADASEALLNERPVYQPETGAYVDTPVYDRDRLRPGHRIVGPAVIEQMDSTTLLLAGQRCQVDSHLNLLIGKGEA